MAKLPLVISANPRKQKSTKITFWDPQNLFLDVKLKLWVKKLRGIFSKYYTWRLNTYKNGFRRNVLTLDFIFTIKNKFCGSQKVILVFFCFLGISEIDEVSTYL